LNFEMNIPVESDSFEHFASKYELEETWQYSLIWY